MTNGPGQRQRGEGSSAADRALLQARQRTEEEIIRETGNAREMTVFLDSAGNVVLTRLGGADSVTWSAAELVPFVGRVRLVTHNHPRGTPPSLDDLALAMFLGALGIDAITERQRYRLWTPTGVWPEPGDLDTALRELHDPLLLRVWEDRDAGRLTDRDVDLLFYRLLWERLERRFPDRLRYEQEDRR